VSNCVVEVIVIATGTKPDPAPKTIDDLLAPALGHRAARLDNSTALANDRPGTGGNGGAVAVAAAEAAGQNGPAQAAGAPLVRLKGIAKSYGNVAAVKRLDLEIRRGDFLAILGPSGCGKTTLLRIIGGFVAPSTGTVEIDGADMTRLGPEKRPTNTVFQGYGLFPHMSVRQNIAYGLTTAKRPRDEIARRVDEAIGLVRLGEFVERAIDQLSGGQQQRVALARALIMRPRVLLLDEPLAALDLKLRQAMQEELRRIHQEIGGTFVFVTHDQGEALGLANRIAVMDQGVIVQQGGPEEIYAAPKTRFVSTFIGEANVFQGTRTGGTVALAAGANFQASGPDGPVTAVVRHHGRRARGRHRAGRQVGRRHFPGRLRALRGDAGRWPARHPAQPGRGLAQAARPRPAGQDRLGARRPAGDRGLSGEASPV
jgi:ABC-type Fe3+/spermidine/putrescine transport system ATPase subunit